MACILSMCKIDYKLHKAFLSILCERNKCFKKFRLKLTGSWFKVENIARQHNYSFVRKSQNPDKALSHTSLINSLQKCSSVKEQIEIFHSSVKLSDKDIISRYTACQDIEKILKPYFPSCFVCLVGSSRNGLGLKGCDVDLSLQFSDRQNNENSVSHNVCVHESIHQLKVPVEFYKSLPKKQLLKIRKILEDLNFKESTVIPGRYPILNFHLHNLSCDLSINNSSALHATNLMTLCGKLDGRIPPLMQIINYWAKHSKLIGPGSKFKSYALFLLMIYFLQTRNPPVLPAVETIFEKSDFLQNLESWSYDIGKYLNTFELSSNSQNIDELLREFFFFYANFDFSYVICPISGNAVDKKKFASQSDFDLKSSICIQDPINLSWNVTSGANWKNCTKFSKAVVSVCEKYQNPNCWIPGSQNWGLSSVIDSEFSYANLRDIKEFSLNIPIVSKIADNCKHSDNECTLKKAASYVKYILSHCLLFHCKQLCSYDDLNSLELSPNVKTLIVNKLLNDTDFNYLTGGNSINVDNFKDIQDSHSVVRFICATRSTWLHRNPLTSTFSEDENVFEKEHLISKLLDVEQRNSDKEIFYFLCECCEMNFENNIVLNIKFKPLYSDRFIPLLVIFFKEYIPWLMNKLLCDSHTKIRKKLC